MNLQNYFYLDGNAAAGELNRIFALDITVAKGQCANCGAKRHFAETHLYVQCPGLVARCAVCDHVLLRIADAGQRMVLDMRGMSYLAVEISQSQESSVSESK